MPMLLSTELIELVAQSCDSIQDKARLATINRSWYAACIRSLFQTVVIHSPRQCAAFFRYLDEFLKRGWLSYVHRLDLSSFTARGSGWTEAQANALICPKRMRKLLGGCTRMRELYVGEQVMPAFIDPDVLRVIFFQCSRLQVLDFCGCCDAKFASAMARVVKEEPKRRIDSLDSVSFYMCKSLLQSTFFIPFFKKTIRLVRLDLSHSRITSELFTHIDPTALTHLSLQGCHGISCCNTPLIPFLHRATALVELNLTMAFNGMPTSRCCTFCLVHIVQAIDTNMPSLHTLHLGGHIHLDDGVLSNFQSSTLNRLERLSLASSPSITLYGLLAHVIHRAPKLYYLNIADSPLALDFTKYLMVLLEQCNNIQVIEVGNVTDRFVGNGAEYHHPKEWQGNWSLITYGRRTSYSRAHTTKSSSALEDPRFACSNKLPMTNRIPDAPMLKYWCYAY
ncbi:hypothetical protein K492DRAFT_193717 [Lichtheimia hyalospora FSU 10163]|nr:hypothetical protein K492DRAFT_193717 [Lichtheimia hyalospora FSU 10163]